MFEAVYSWIVFALFMFLENFVVTHETACLAVHLQRAADRVRALVHLALHAGQLKRCWGGAARLVTAAMEFILHQQMKV